jgi:hypothetical protein
VRWACDILIVAGGCAQQLSVIETSYVVLRGCLPRDAVVSIEGVVSRVVVLFSKIGLG